MIDIIKSYLALLSKENKKLFNKAIFWNFIRAFGFGFQLYAINYVLKNIIENTATKQTGLYAFLLMVFSVFILYLSERFTRRYSAKASFYMCCEKRRELGNLLRYMPMGYFNDNSIGSITSVATNSLDLIQNEGTRSIVSIVNAILNAILVLTFITIFDYRMGLVVVSTFIVFFIFNLFLRLKAKSLAPRHLKSQIKLVDSVLQYVQGISVIRSYNLINDKTNDIYKSIDESKKTFIALELTLVPFILLENLVLTLGTFVLIVCSLVFYLQNSMSLDTCITMFIASFLVFTDIRQAGAISSITMLVEKNMKMLKDFMNKPILKDGDITSKPSNFDLEAKNIKFSYDNKVIINDMDFYIKEKTTTSIVGPSGGGKTTICNLILRFWDVDSGDIKLGGKSIKDYSVDTLLSCFSMVFQDVYLFNDTIENNVKFGNIDASRQDIINVCKKACIHDFIMSLENGYDTVVGENGANLSGGEKQRLSIARAMLKDSEIIILDEATSNIDPENEELLQNAIKELTKEKTVIMIAHRLNTVRNSDQILVVKDGKVVEKGTHDSLLENSNVYKNFIDIREKSISWKLK